MYIWLKWLYLFGSYLLLTLICLVRCSYFIHFICIHVHILVFNTISILDYVVSFNNSKTGATSGAGTTFTFRSSWIQPVFSAIRPVQILDFCSIVSIVLCFFSVHGFYIFRSVSSIFPFLDIIKYWNYKKTNYGFSLFFHSVFACQSSWLFHIFDSSIVATILNTQHT